MINILRNIAIIFSLQLEILEYSPWVNNHFFITFFRFLQAGVPRGVKNYFRVSSTERSCRNASLQCTERYWISAYCLKATCGKASRTYTVCDYLLPPLAEFQNEWSYF